MNTNNIQQTLKSIAITGVAAILFFSCNGVAPSKTAAGPTEVAPQGIAENFVLYYTETPDLAEIPMEVAMGAALKKPAHLTAILRSELSEDFQHLNFPYRTFPNGLVLEVFDAKGQKSVITSDYGIIYSATNVIDLRGNVVITTHEGRVLKTPQLYYDKTSEWVFTSEKFTYTNPEDQTVMDGKGMDFSRDFSKLNAHKTFGFVTIKEETND